MGLSHNLRMEVIRMDENTQEARYNKAMKLCKGMSTEYLLARIALELQDIATILMKDYARMRR